jgi:hypothetical protein
VFGHFDVTWNQTGKAGPDARISFGTDERRIGIAQQSLRGLERVRVGIETALTLPHVAPLAIGDARQERA